jgi:hypothetical protein
MSRVESFRADRVVEGAQFLTKIGTTDDPHGLTARSFNNFWDILKRAKVRYLRSEPIYNCPIHLEADRNVRKLAEAQDDLSTAEADLDSFGPFEEDENQKLDLAAKVARLKLTVAQYHKLVERDQVHQKHYEMARKYVKNRETNLKPNEVLVFRDFVNQYNEKGTKVSNLVFVIIRAAGPHWMGLVLSLTMSTTLQQQSVTHIFMLWLWISSYRGMTFLKKGRT